MQDMARGSNPRMAHILSATTTIIALFVASVAFAQQEQPRPQQRPGADGTVGSGMMQGMDCQRMMQGQAGANPGAMNEQMKAMMEQCRRMMGQTPSPPSAPDKKE